MGRVLFAHGHLLRFDRKQYAIGKPYPPLATLFAAAHCARAGTTSLFTIPMLDDDTPGFGAALDAIPPDVVVIYDDSFNWLTKMCLSTMREAALCDDRAGAARGRPVIAAGHDAADEPEVYLAAGATFVLLGEGEMTLGELARVEETRERRAARGMPPPPSLDWPCVAGAFFGERAARKLLQNLDVLPLPAWDLVDIERYRSFWRHRHGYFSLNVVTTRGCPYLCNWCAKPVYGNTYHSRSPANVLAELRLLRERYAPDHLWFCDDILGLKSRWLIAWSPTTFRRRGCGRRSFARPAPT